MTLFGLKSDKLLFISFCTVWPNAIIKTTAIIPIAVPVIVKNDLNLFDFIDMKISFNKDLTNIIKSVKIIKYNLQYIFLKSNKNYIDFL